MGLDIDKYLVSLDQDPLFLVFLDLRKSYHNLDHGRLLKTLERYGVGSKMRDILAEFWAWQDVVTQKMAIMTPSSGLPL